MSKAILVMDMPDGCGDCPLDDGEWEVCNGIAQVDCPLSKIGKYRCEYYRDHRRPDWCPLIPEPERNPDREVLFSGTSFTIDEINDAFELGEDTGWNAFIDYLEGKT